MARPGTPSLSMQLECLFRRFPILCGECGYRIEWTDEKDWDHFIEHADGGEHSAVNLRPVHSRTVGCHKRKTKRATTQRARVIRLEKVKNGLPKRARPKRKIPAKLDHKWQSRPMQSRGWR